MNREQFKAILWLRWRLFRNQFSRAGTFNAVISILLLVTLLVAALGMGVMGLMFGALSLPPLHPLGLLLVWDGVTLFFLVFWLTGLMIEIQRSESVDLTKLLHLPVTLRQVFVFNYAASHFTVSILLLGSLMFGLAVGLAFDVPQMALLLPLVAGFIFVVTAWTYCLRGWLAALMTNKRRRRTIIMWIIIGVFLLSQLPNLMFNTRLFGRNDRRGADARSTGPMARETAVHAHAFIPPGWVGYGAMHLRAGNPWPALGLTAAALLAGGFGLLRAYRMTIRFYQGADDAKAPQRSPQIATAPAARGRMLIERELRWLPDDTAALALATFRSLTRAPELKMALIMPAVIFLLVMSSALSALTRDGEKFSNSPLVTLVSPFVVMLAALALAPTMSNAFGLDRNGFRALVLLPTQRAQVLLAKNCAFLPFVASVAFLMLTGAAILVRMPIASYVTGLLQIPTAFLLFSPVCNCISILAPYRLASGTLNAKKPKVIIFVAAFAAMLLTPIVLIPLLVPAAVQLMTYYLGGPAWVPFHLLTAAVILAGVAWLYRELLPFQGRLLQRREQAILREVTQETE